MAFLVCRVAILLSDSSLDFYYREEALEMGNFRSRWEKVGGSTKRGPKGEGEIVKEELFTRPPYVRGERLCLNEKGRNSTERGHLHSHTHKPQIAQKG